MQETPRANRLHIGLFGKRNSGKSSLINALTNQEVALVSDIAGTTTDPVYKAMEIHGIGPCVFIDTAGLDDEGELGALRIQQTMRAMDRTDIALLVCTGDDIEKELEWSRLLKEKNIPVIWILNKADLLTDVTSTIRSIEKKCGQVPLGVSACTKQGMEDIRRSLIAKLPDETMSRGIVGKLVEEGDTVMLVMPQDIQAPKGRLILPQVQTIRELLDRKCLVMSCTTGQIDRMLQALVHPPKLIITDSQVFKTVYEKKPFASKLTSFSVLFAQYKGDIDYFIEGANAIGRLTENSRVLIAEACTHAPLTEDIGRVKIPNMLRKKFGSGLLIEHVSGTDFPEDLSKYDLIIHCGACMFNRKYVLSRVEQARKQNIPMTNYGVTIAYLAGILDKIDY
ncbi:[FeFe] hydrogenase H-cluster maturation GTPase HydF [Phocaeicola coprocola]|jgi:[FeFe] hydrogenase H-cluster maturation GTPase HydF|uniref:[FeFe] hydrogenase H-cluster maturation GTPase HydF n=1 Tax=Phocaeicola coprocola TaxID=310298 RepID=A0A412GDF3_9BACT|nr:[FeFe] hydrogenase H-cluster maturation GTPase HydF [Phocaeicola coprocola]RGR92809.1 [FeFe] hydrogenase H-cluster maturation GTPase HydF [Phocaeicola coprocola]